MGAVVVAGGSAGDGAASCGVGGVGPDHGAHVVTPDHVGAGSWDVWIVAVMAAVIVALNVWAMLTRGDDR